MGWDKGRYKLNQLRINQLLWFKQSQINMQSVEVQTPSKTFLSSLVPPSSQDGDLTGRAEIAYPWGQLKGVVDCRTGVLRAVPCTTCSYTAADICGQIFWQSWGSRGSFPLNWLHLIPGWLCKSSESISTSSSSST